MTGTCRKIPPGDIGVDGDALAAFLQTLAQGAVLFGSGGTGVGIQTDAANFFWDIVNKYLGIGTNSPAYPLHVVAQNSNPITGPSSAAASAQTGVMAGYAMSEDLSFQYSVYAKKNVSGTDYYAPVPSTSNQVTTALQTISGPTPSNTQGTIQYAGGGYTASGITTTMDVYCRKTTPQGVVWSVTPGQANVTDDSMGGSYSINWTWDNDPSTDDIYLLRNGSDYLIVPIGLTNNFLDANTSWSFGGGSAPTPTSVYETMNVLLTWTPTSSPDGYRILRNFQSAGYIEYLDVGAVSTFTDDNSTPFTSGSTVVPNSIFGDALFVLGNIGFYGSTPTPQYVPGGSSGFNIGGGTDVHDDSTFTGNIGTTAYTIGDIIRCCKLLGIMLT